LEQTLVILKPDALQRCLLGKILTRIELQGLRISALKMIHISKEQAREYAAEHANQPFFLSVIEYITSAPSVVAIVEGVDAVKTVRAMIGVADPRDSFPGTIRRDFCLAPQYNLIHGSADPKAATREIDIFFTPEEICSYNRDIDKWIWPNEEVNF
jgi:nucleoside-diphosphate kinase